MSYFGARYYMAAVGRWGAVDPLADQFPGWSGYNYVLGNPTGLVDPDGRASCDIVLCGQNGSSLTIKTDRIDVEVDVSRLPGTDFGGNHVLQGEDVLLAALDVVGVVDPSGVADGLAAGIYAGQGERGNAAISLAGLIPLGGDLFKAGRIGKQLNRLREAIS
ncbi:MAG: RHS repeat-associated core domain-containing protein, partial [Longimicrobiales bacterium]|nr:RHS repeat-associated core domain-containing protein [Longimicrobiales bacterium]